MKHNKRPIGKEMAKNSPSHCRWPTGFFSNRVPPSCIPVQPLHHPGPLEVVFAGGHDFHPGGKTVSVHISPDNPLPFHNKSRFNGGLSGVRQRVASGDPIVGQIDIFHPGFKTQGIVIVPESAVFAVFRPGRSDGQIRVSGQERFPVDESEG